MHTNQALIHARSSEKPFARRSSPLHSEGTRDYGTAVCLGPQDLWAHASLLISIHPAVDVGRVTTEYIHLHCMMITVVCMLPWDDHPTDA